MERVRSIETSLDISISTFPHQVELNRIRRRIALHRDVHTFFQAVGDNIFDNFEELRTRYTHYQNVWFELKSCIENDIRNQIDLFLQIIPNDHAFTTLQNGLLTGLDVNTADFLSRSFRENRPRYTLRNYFLSQQLSNNPFYIHTSENFKQLLTDFIYCTIVFPKSGGLVFSFQRPHPTHLPEGFHARQQIVLFEEEYEDNFPHVVPLVPFVHYGGSYCVLDTSEYNMALPLPIPESDTIPRVPLTSNDHLTSILHDHDALFQLNMTPLPDRDLNQVGNLIEQILNILDRGGDTNRPVTIPNELRVLLLRRSSS